MLDGARFETCSGLPWRRAHKRSLKRTSQYRIEDRLQDAWRQARDRAEPRLVQPVSPRANDRQNSRSAGKLAIVHELTATPIQFFLILSLVYDGHGNEPRFHTRFREPPIGDDRLTLSPMKGMVAAIQRYSHNVFVLIGPDFLQSHVDF